MKDVNEFATFVAEHLFDANQEMANNHQVEVKEVIKNNGLILTGITVKEDGSNIAPTIYLNDAFKHYEEGEDIKDVLTELLNTYEAHRVPGALNVEFLTDFNQAKERVAMKVINYEKNQKLLTGSPHIKFGDLAAIFQIQVDASEFGNAVITVKNEFMDMWNTDVETLMNLSRENMEEHQPMRIRSMLEVLTEMMGDIPDEMVEESPMYVLTNEAKINGAAAMIFTDKLQEFAEKKNSNFFILPSSIHEVILVMDNGNMDVESLINMVREVNDTQVSADEVLSYNIYYYDRFTKALMMAVTKEIIA